MTMQLNEYNEKRNFGKTFEPEGKREDSDEQLKFVIQHHLARIFLPLMERISDNNH